MLDVRVGPPREGGVGARVSRCPWCDAAAAVRWLLQSECVSLPPKKAVAPLPPALPTRCRVRVPLCLYMKYMSLGQGATVGMNQLTR